MFRYRFMPSSSRGSWIRTRRIVLQLWGVGTFLDMAVEITVTMRKIKKVISNDEPSQTEVENLCCLRNIEQILMKKKMGKTQGSNLS